MAKRELELSELGDKGYMVPCWDGTAEGIRRYINHIDEAKELGIFTKDAELIYASLCRDFDEVNRLYRGQIYHERMLHKLRNIEFFLLGHNSSPWKWRQIKKQTWTPKSRTSWYSRITDRENFRNWGNMSSNICGNFRLVG